MSFFSSEAARTATRGKSPTRLKNQNSTTTASPYTPLAANYSSAITHTPVRANGHYVKLNLDGVVGDLDYAQNGTGNAQQSTTDENCKEIKVNGEQESVVKPKESETSLQQAAASHTLTDGLRLPQQQDKELLAYVSARFGEYFALLECTEELRREKRLIEEENRDLTKRLQERDKEIERLHKELEEMRVKFEITLSNVTHLNERATKKGT